MQGQKLCLTVGQGCGFGSLPRRVSDVFHSCRVLWPRFPEQWIWMLCLTVGLDCKFALPPGHGMCSMAAWPCAGDPNQAKLPTELTGLTGHWLGSADLWSCWLGSLLGRCCKQECVLPGCAGYLPLSESQ